MRIEAAEANVKLHMLHEQLKELNNWRQLLRDQQLRDEREWNVEEAMEEVAAVGEEVVAVVFAVEEDATFRCTA
jgi:hypothetical protein